MQLHLWESSIGGELGTMASFSWHRMKTSGIMASLINCDRCYLPRPKR